MTSSYQSSLSSFTKFEAEHQWWTHETWFLAENLTIKQFVVAEIQNSQELTQLIHQGTHEELTEFYELLRDSAPLISMGVMKGLLDHCYRQEKLQEPFSKDLVKWFREMGWKFPEFEFEKIETAAQQLVSIQ